MRKLSAIIAGLSGTALLSGMLVVVAARTEVRPAEPAEVYKTKCVACHGKKAEKKFDTTISDDQMVEAILKGKKAAKPPNMPAYGEKGVTAEQAKALVDYMKQLKATP
ncbi:MAG TPA: cytochrome c [Pyrinomonadaceae bacterium]|nr:cytochrome c [Pyrinomonadaceae bacterium]